MSDQKIIHDLGSLEGKLLFFGGVYSNLQALEALQKWAGENGYLPNHIFCTGDILGYCAQPVECVELIREWNIYSIAGNVELQVREDKDNCGCHFTSGGRCDVFSKNWYSYIQSKMNTRTKEWLHTLPHHIQFDYGQHKLTMVHGSWFDTSEFIFDSTPWLTKQNNFDASGSTIIVAGHCGLPFINQQAPSTWLNPGVIGIPANDGTTRVWFATLEEDEKNETVYKFHSYQYDNKKASELIRKEGLPPSYADTLLTGLWDNCEILPEEEANKQGKIIIL